jgi:hypothetical protein
MSKVMSLALFPPVELYQDADERLEMYWRVRRAVERLEDVGAFEV